jgi:hypothetical protein
VVAFVFGNDEILAAKIANYEHKVLKTMSYIRPVNLKWGMVFNSNQLPDSKLVLKALLWLLFQ